MTCHEKAATFDDVSIQINKQTSYYSLWSFKLVNFAQSAGGVVPQISMSTCLLVQVSVFTNDINNLRNKKEKERTQLERLTIVQCSI